MALVLGESFRDIGCASCDQDSTGRSRTTPTGPRLVRCLAKSSAIRNRATVIQTSPMSPASMRTTILWIHALGGVAWVGAATVFVIASSVVGTEDDEGLAMV